MMATAVADTTQAKGRGPSGRRLVCVQGLGFVGAANAIAIASARDAAGEPAYDVIGIELPTELGHERASKINNGEFPFAVTDTALVAAARKAKEAGNLTATIGNADYAKADIIVVNVGLDIEEKGERPTFRVAPFREALSVVGDLCAPDALILLESTVPPGTCEHIVMPLLRERLAARGLSADNLKVAYCYERVMPGDNYLNSVIDIWRVYAGMTPQAGDAAESFLSSYINVKNRPLRRLASVRAAEMAKVLENTFRAVNIALIDEWEKFARRIDVDLFEVLEAIRVRPTHQNIRYPGLGVGGYCLSKDPMFGAASAREIYSFTDLPFPLSTTSVHINDAMPLTSVAALEGLFSSGVSGKRILILGASYREGVSDTRLSPSGTLADALIAKGAVVEIADPLVESFPEVEVPLHRKLPPAQRFDVVVLAVGHRDYKTLDIAAWAGSARPAIFDSNGVFTAPQLEQLAAAGFKVAGIGRAIRQ